MPSPKDVAVFIGNLRKESLTRKTILALTKIALPPFVLSIVGKVGGGRFLAAFGRWIDSTAPAK